MFTVYMHGKCNELHLKFFKFTGDVWKPKSKLLSVIIMQYINGKTLIEIVIVMFEKCSYKMSPFSNRNKAFHADFTNKVLNIVTIEQLSRCQENAKLTKILSATRVVGLSSKRTYRQLTSSTRKPTTLQN